MSQKKKSGDLSSVATRAAPMSAASAGSDSASHKPQGIPRTQTAGNGRPKNEDRFWLEVAVVRMSRWLGSLQVAVLLLGLFAIVLAIGTMMESWYSEKIAKELVYRAWWFNLLLLLLGVNIFFAAAKKWPWKKHQTGFLITHVGLLTMVAGGLLTGLRGTDTSMALIDTDDLKAQHSAAGEFGAGIVQASHEVSDRDSNLIRVREIRDGKQHDITFPFKPGSLTWRGDEYLQPKLDGLLAALNWLSHPLPQSWQADVGNGARLDVLNFYPHVRRDPYRPAQPDDSAETLAAVKVLVLPPEKGPASQMGEISQWLAADGEASRLGGGAMQMLGPCPGELVGEFLAPPADAGKKGTLVVLVDGDLHRLSVDRLLDRPAQALGTSGWKIRILGYDSNVSARGGSSEPSNPRCQFELAAPDGVARRYGVYGRMPGQAFASRDSGKNNSALPTVWYHAPDQRFGEDPRGLLQLVCTPERKLYYRSYASSKGTAFHFESKGEAVPGGDAYPIWSGMKFRFRVLDFLPTAVAEPWYIPEDARPGLEDPQMRLRPALRCRLTVGDKSKEFWVPQTEQSVTPVEVGGREFGVGFNDQKMQLGFDVKLLRAEQTVDPGTDQPASYTSYVQITDKAEGIDAQDAIITMNQPLTHRGYKFYQTSLQPAGPDQRTLKPTNLSVLTVSRDPGLPLKYVGSSMLALGIACMFYMKAYFFKPRGRKAPALAPAVVGEGN